MSDDLKSDLRNSTIIIDKKFTFVERFLQKKKLRYVIFKLVENKSLSPNVLKPDTFSLDFQKLSNSNYNLIQNAIQELTKEDDDEKSEEGIISEIPKEYMKLLELEIFNKANSSLDSSEELWDEFARWAYFSISSDIKKKFQNHCYNLWSKISKAYEKSINQQNPIEEQDKDKKFKIIEQTINNAREKIDIKGFKHVFEPQHFKNSFGETMVDFFELTDSKIAKDTFTVVDEYYRHTLDNSSHQSDHFKKDFAEHFGSFTCSNNEPYTTSDMASSHCFDHQKCVQKLIEGLQPLSNDVNDYFKDKHSQLYTKMEKLDLGPNVPKSFRHFPTIAINYNTISNFHRDIKDHPNSLCVVCPLGSFEGGQLVFPELKLIIHAKQGQAIAFRSHILIHGNLNVFSANRHSVVFFIHSTCIKQTRPFGKLDMVWNLDNDHNNDNSKELKSGFKIKNSSRRAYLGKYFNYFKISIYYINF